MIRKKTAENLQFVFILSVFNFFMSYSVYSSIKLRACLTMFSSPSPEAFKARLDAALDSLVWWLATLHIHRRGLKLDDRCGPFQSKPFYDSIIPKSS